MVSSFSRPGTHHTETGQDNQDVIKYGETDRYLVMSMADGVSSCSRAGEGAKIAASRASKIMLSEPDLIFGLPDPDFPEYLLSSVLADINRRAKRDRIPAEEYSSTLTSVLYDKLEHRMIYFNLGDSIILVTGNGKCGILSAPYTGEEGCCVTTTRYAHTEASTGKLSCGGIDSIIICSDGAWRHMFNRNKLIPEIEGFLTDGDIQKLYDYLDSLSCSDDYSIIFTDFGDVA